MLGCLSAHDVSVPGDQIFRGTTIDSQRHWVLNECRDTEMAERAGGVKVNTDLLLERSARWANADTPRIQGIGLNLSRKTPIIDSNLLGGLVPFAPFFHGNRTRGYRPSATPESIRSHRDGSPCSKSKRNVHLLFLSRSSCYCLVLFPNAAAESYNAKAIKESS